VGTWNVQSLYRSGALKNLMNAVQEYNVYITAIQEMMWIGQNIMNKKTFTTYYSCHNSIHQFGTEFVVNNRVRHVVIDF
jgi:hypothetical protein